MHPFRAAIEARDLDALPALFTEDARFLSPVAFAPYQGRANVGAILRGVGRVLKDFEYVREIDSADGSNLALLFTARVGDRQVHGCDFLHLAEDGLIDELCVMVRPLSAVQAFAAAMGEQFETIRREVEQGGVL